MTTSSGKRSLPNTGLQPIVMDKSGIARFKENGIVRFLIDWSSSRGISMNDLALMTFSEEDRQQFAQLIGYSVEGYAELGYHDANVLDVADKQVRALLMSRSCAPKKTSRKRKVR